MTADTREEVARVARMLARSGLVEAFGHVSARTEAGFVITGVAPMFTATAGEMIVFETGTGPVAGPTDRSPLEAPLHAAIYAARTDVGSICRGHPPATVQWGTGVDDLPLRHGLGALAGVRVRVHDHRELITRLDQADRVAATLGDDASVILRANGALSVGTSPLEAATRLYYLEERARVATATTTAADIDTATWERRVVHSGPELTRAMTWFEARFSDDPTT